MKWLDKPDEMLHAMTDVSVRDLMKLNWDWEKSGHNQQLNVIKLMALGGGRRVAKRVAAGGVSIRQSLVPTTTMSESTAIFLCCSHCRRWPSTPSTHPPGAKRFPMVPIQEEEEHPLNILYPPPFYLFCYDPTQMFAKVERTHIHHLTTLQHHPLWFFCICNQVERPRVDL